MSRTRTVPTLAALTAAAIACGSDAPGGTGDPPTGGITFAAAVQPIFTSSCAFATSCHAGTSPQEGMNLGAGQAYANIVNVLSSQVPTLSRVLPGEPDSSYLIMKLEGTAGLVGGIGTRMPLGGQLSPARIDTIRAWIAAGAPDN